MSADNALSTAVITRIEFARSVDRDVLRQLADLNLRGLQAIKALRSPSIGGSSVFASLGGAMADEALSRRLGDAPFLMFEWRSLAHWRVNESAEVWREQAEWSAFARLAAHFSAEVCRHRRPAALLLLGMPAEQCDAWARLSFAEIDTCAQRASQQIDLRWWTDSPFWQRRLQAVTDQDDGALWHNTLEGIQRLAALARPRG